MRKLRRSAARLQIIGRKVLNKLFPPAGPLPVAAPPMQQVAEDIAGRVVIITGSSSGIGLALARGFLDAGARVVLNGRHRGRLDAALQALSADAARVHAIEADVSTEAGAQALVREARARFGCIDVLINNAAVTGPHATAAGRYTDTDWTRVLRGNVLSAAFCVAAAHAQARMDGRALRVVNVSSGIVGHAAPGLAGYGVSKDGLEALGRAFAIDDDSGLLSITSLRPRSVRTDMTKGYYDAATFALMEDAEVLLPAFLWAATAPAAEVNGRAFHEQVVSASKLAAVRIPGVLAGGGAIDILPETFRDAAAGQAEGAYMHLLENAQGFYPSARGALESSLDRRDLYAYPDPTYAELKAAIAAEVGVESACIAIAPGSSELIDRMLRLFCAPGDSIVITKPTWSFFHAFAQRWQLIPSEVSMRGDLRSGGLMHDLAGLLAAVTPRTRLVYLCNPCNPTGAMLEPSALEAFIRKVPAHVVLVVDEAYLQYAEPAMRPSLAQALDSCAASVVLLRTFSKFFGLSGMRLGYAVARPELVRLLARAEVPFSISAPAARIAPEVLADQAFRDRVYRANVEGREQLSAGLTALDIAVQPSQTNFILFNCPTDPATLRARLRSRGLVLPNVDQFVFHNYALLAVGQPEHNSIVLDELGRF
ncbi:aminotransferase class I/II-fold pyridoxal phosphate-dependent enzyme [Methyloversatilis sp. XJ19-49]|uniref:aminotransferase class I/II-fold pyridoxal phosphate-dependent enzyme n=1 Tax=Methyloversatilis sp. XJ19-49 TaxID=2963429 RepID=UPI00211B86D3|nr:aminotransferase class I/II-fold pyridoxal phosphate-dependent enzyme [Methyloversatilis sp. XJ19-49]MCQ9376823.1 aminotransferase class I/II-fold pyridoxal phosphate-dependent enzyme [Methyloversatilis sp. XJ19-49]